MPCPYFEWVICGLVFLNFAFGVLCVFWLSLLCQIDVHWQGCRCQAHQNNLWSSNWNFKSQEGLGWCLHILKTAADSPEHHSQQSSFIIMHHMHTWSQLAASQSWSFLCHTDLDLTCKKIQNHSMPWEFMPALSQLTINLVSRNLVLI